MLIAVITLISRIRLTLLVGTTSSVVTLHLDSLHRQQLLLIQYCTLVAIHTFVGDYSHSILSESTDIDDAHNRYGY